jgi:hypothetical protein
MRKILTNAVDEIERMLSPTTCFMEKMLGVVEK